MIRSAAIDDEVLGAAHEAVVTLAVSLLVDGVRDRDLAPVIEWLVAHRELERDATHLLRAADALLR